MDSDESDAGGSQRRRKPNVAELERRSNGHGRSRNSLNPSSSSPVKRKRVPDVGESEDEEHANGDVGPSDDDDDEAHESPHARTTRKGKGRVSVSDNGNGHVNGNYEAEDENDETGSVAASTQVPQYRPEYQRHADGYVTGSITRIKLIDFMTYDFVEFNPGPHLNMILGPNGTGKSTIAAGIAIGLGFTPDVMGRATDLQSYIKQGKEEAWTEIEIRGKPGKRNHVIWRRFGRDGKREYKLNGQKELKKTVLALVASLGIQANNLCCFLPQDRVAEFAKMAPPTTLTETMRAAGNPRLSEWHAQLVSKGSEKKILDERLLGDTARRDQLQAQVDSLAPDVQHFERREAQEFQKEIMELAVEFARASEQKTLTEELKERVKAVDKEARALKAKNKPLEDLHTWHGKRKDTAAAKVVDLKKALHDNAQAVSKAQSRLQDKLDEAGEVDTELDQLKRRIKRMEQDKARQLEKIQKAEEVLSHPREEISDRWNEKGEKKKEILARRRQVEVKVRDLRDRRKELEIDLRNIDVGINEKMRKQRELSNIENIRKLSAIRMNGSIGYALDWLEHHAHELEHPVMLPPCISVNVPDKRYAWQIEQCLTYGQRSTFICQSRNDYDTLNMLNNRQYPSRQLPNGQSLPGGVVNLHLVCLTPTDANVNAPPPCSAEKMRSLGLDGCATRFVEAEPAVIAFLSESCNFSRTALSQQSTVDGQAVADAGFTAWVTKNESFRGQRSRYGRRAFQFSSTPSRPASFLNMSVDQQAIAELARDIAELKRRKVDSEQPFQKNEEELSSVSASQRKVDAAEEEINLELKVIKGELLTYDKAKTDLELARGELEKLAARPTESAERDRLKAQKLAKALSCLPNLSTLSNIHDVGDTQAANAVSAGLAFAQADRNVRAIDKKREAGTKDEKRLAKEQEALIVERTKALTKYNDYYARLQDKLATHSKPVRQEFSKRIKDSQYKDMSVADAKAELATIMAELEISEGINPAVIERHRKLSAELESIIKNVVTSDEDLQKVNKSIKTIMDKFQPALESLVASISDKFSTAFDREGRSGDVRLDRDDRGYEYWGLIPHVSFRDGEAMQPLTGHRQSGGERSYSTIMYLMALSEMARVPFSLVDEINQGMDQQAERTVFNQLVETTCDANAGQYFLITPKLLTDLTYHERMKVLIVNNGYWLPEGTDKTQKFGDIRGCLKRYKASIAAR